MDEVFDLFGDPVPAGRGKRGRPQHIATRENCNKVKLLLALGRPIPTIASALGITDKTLTRHYSGLLKARFDQRPKMEAAYLMTVWEKARAGIVGAMRLWQQIMERELDAMPGIQTVNDLDGTPVKLGKKEQAARDAHNIPEAWRDRLGIVSGDDTPRN